jgi:hypothetical protein
MPNVSVKPTGRALWDGDLDVFVDLGEAVVRAPTPTPQPKSRSTSPVPPGFFSLVRDASAIPPIGPRQPGERGRSPYFLLCVFCSHLHALNVVSVLCSGRRSCSCRPVAANTAIHHSRALVAPGCNSEEARRSTSECIHGNGGVKTEKACQDEKGSAR